MKSPLRVLRRLPGPAYESAETQLSPAEPRWGMRSRRGQGCVQVHKWVEDYRPDGVLAGVSTQVLPCFHGHRFTHTNVSWLPEAVLRAGNREMTRTKGLGAGERTRCSLWRAKGNAFITAGRQPQSILMKFTLLRVSLARYSIWDRRHSSVYSLKEKKVP